jgi:hypothetical protein
LSHGCTLTPPCVSLASHARLSLISRCTGLNVSCRGDTTRASVLHRAVPWRHDTACASALPPCRAVRPGPSARGGRGSKFFASMIRSMTMRVVQQGAQGRTVTTPTRPQRSAPVVYRVRAVPCRDITQHRACQHASAAPKPLASCAVRARVEKPPSPVPPCRARAPARAP